jgi:hypothetical protein
MFEIHVIIEVYLFMSVVFCICRAFLITSHIGLLLFFMNGYRDRRLMLLFYLLRCLGCRRRLLRICLCLVRFRIIDVNNAIVI